MTTRADRDALETSLEHAAELVANATAIFLAAGAGMGVDSGLPDFCDDEGFWQAYPAFREAKLQFRDMASRERFALDPRQAWGFYGHRLALYRKTLPHPGFALLKNWMASKPLGYSVFTSNVDGQFERAGFAPDRMNEWNGSIHRLQCTRPCSEATWSADNLELHIDDSNCTWLGALPTCPHCGALARPNILMFDDSSWVDKPSLAQAQLQNDWLGRCPVPLVIEVGAGKAVRVFSQKVMKRHKGCLIRIDAGKAGKADETGEAADDDSDVTLAMPVLEALQAIDQLLNNSRGPGANMHIGYRLCDKAPGITGIGQDLNKCDQAVARKPLGRTGKLQVEQTLRRRLALLALLPGSDNPGIDIRTLTGKLQKEGYQCVRRTVERDLLEILDAKTVWRGVGIDVVSKADPLDARRRVFTHKSHSKAFALRSPSGADGLLSELLAQELQAFLPAPAVPAMQYYQPSSCQVAQGQSEAEHARYRKKVCSLPDGPPMCPPRIDPGHFHELNEALLRDEQIDMHYQDIGQDECRYRLHPVGLVKKGRLFWLIAAEDRSGMRFEEVRSFRMDRVRSLRRRLNDPVAAQLPSLADVLDNGALEFFPVGQLKLLVHSAPGKAGDRLIEKYMDTPFSADQRVCTLEQGGYALSATVRYSRELVCALQEQAHLLRVVAPEKLRQELERFAVQVAAWYGQAPNLSIESAPLGKA